MRQAAFFWDEHQYIILRQISTFREAQIWVWHSWSHLLRVGVSFSQFGDFLYISQVSVTCILLKNPLNMQCEDLKLLPLALMHIVFLQCHLLMLKDTWTTLTLQCHVMQILYYGLIEVSNWHRIGILCNRAIIAKKEKNDLPAASLRTVNVDVLAFCASGASMNSGPHSDFACDANTQFCGKYSCYKVNHK